MGRILAAAAVVLAAALPAAVTGERKSAVHACRAVGGGRGCMGCLYIDRGLCWGRGQELLLLLLLVVVVVVIQSADRALDWLAGWLAHPTHPTDPASSIPPIIDRTQPPGPCRTTYPLNHTHTRPPHNDTRLHALGRLCRPAGGGAPGGDRAGAERAGDDEALRPAAAGDQVDRGDRGAA